MPGSTVVVTKPRSIRVPVHTDICLYQGGPECEQMPKTTHVLAIPHMISGKYCI